MCWAGAKKNEKHITVPRKRRRGDSKVHTVFLLLLIQSFHWEAYYWTKIELSVGGSENSSAVFLWHSITACLCERIFVCVCVCVCLYVCMKLEVKWSELSRVTLRSEEVSTKRRESIVSGCLYQHLTAYWLTSRWLTADQAKPSLLSLCLCVFLFSFKNVQK